MCHCQRQAGKACARTHVNDAQVGLSASIREQQWKRRERVGKVTDGNAFRVSDGGEVEPLIPLHKLACQHVKVTENPRGQLDAEHFQFGQQEAVGIQKWMQDTVAKFKANTGNTIAPTLMSTDNVIPQFTNAAAAGHPPDIQFLFNGIYHMENVWLGYIAPLNGLVSDQVLADSGATQLSVFEGKQYRVGFYSIGFGIAYSKELFDQAGLDADNPPQDWDSFMSACDKLKSSGVQPIGAGVKA